MRRQRFATPEAREHAQLIASLQKFSSNTANSSRMQMLMPLHQLQERRVRCQLMLVCQRISRSLCSPSSLFKESSYTRRPSQRYERVIVSHQNTRVGFLCSYLTPSAQETWKDYTVFKSVTWVGHHGPEVASGMVGASRIGRTDVMVPEFTLDWFTNNESPEGSSRFDAVEE